MGTVLPKKVVIPLIASTRSAAALTRPALRAARMCAGGVGCIASVASELNIVAKVVDLIQGIGCDIIGKFVSGILGLDYNKMREALISIVYTAVDLGLEAELLIKMLIKVVACIDGYFGISKTFLVNIAYTLTEVTSAVSGNQTAMVALESPAGLIVKDSKGNATGINAAGQTFDDVPDSVFIKFPKSDLKLVFLTDTGGDKYEVITRATAAGTINVKTARSDGKAIEKMEFNDITQDSETQTDLAFKTKVGSGTANMEIPLKDGGEISKTGQLSIEKIDETKIPDKFRAKGLNIFGGFSILKILKILIVLIVLIFGVNLIRRKREFILKIFKKRKEKEGLAEKIGAKKEEKPRTLKSIIVNIIKFIIYFDLGGLAILTAVSAIKAYGLRMLVLAIPLSIAGAASFYLAVKLVKDRKLSFKHLIIAILLMFAINLILNGLLFVSQRVMMR